MKQLSSYSPRFHYQPCRLQRISLLAGALMSTTEKLQRIINAANHFITNTRKFDLGLTYMRRHVLHWLDMSDRIQFRQSVSVSLATSVYTEWHLVTCQTCADQWLHFKDDVTCVLLVAAIMTYLVSDVPLWKLVVFLRWPICLERITWRFRRHFPQPFTESI